jgi:uncharacterized membrane protein YjjP (DUF1212 family)
MMPGPGSDAAVELVLKLGRGLHTVGYPAHRLEAALEQVSRRLGLEGQFFSMPTALFASFGTPPEQRTYQIRVEPGSHDLERLARFDELIAAVGSGAMTPAEASARADEVLSAAPRYGPGLTTVCFALSSAAASRFFGGGVREVVAAGAVGLFTGLLALWSDRLPALARIFEPAAACGAATLAAVLAAWFPPVSPYVATLAGLIILVPGFSLTVAVIELASRHLISGTARMAGAAGTFLAIGFGVALGTRVGEALAGQAPPPHVVPLPDWALWAALVVAPLTFTVLLKARPQEAPWFVAAGYVAFFGARLGALLLGPELGAFLGALAVGAFSNAYSRLVGRPGAVLVVPGVLLLVPGSIGFQSLSRLIERDTLIGVEAAFRMTLVAVALATGLLCSSVVMPPRRQTGDALGPTDGSS